MNSSAIVLICVFYVINWLVVAYAWGIARKEYDKKWKLIFDLAIPFGIFVRFIIEGIGDVISVFKEMFQFLTKK